MQDKKCSLSYIYNVSFLRLNNIKQHRPKMAVTVFLITFSGALFCESSLKTVKNPERRAEKKWNVIRCYCLCHIASQFVSHNQNDGIQWKILNENMSREDTRILERKHLGWLKRYVDDEYQLLVLQLAVF